MIGLFQTFALRAGISRSRNSMVGGLARGLSHEDAARFSFLRATPVILAAGFLKVPSLAGVRLADGSRVKLEALVVAPVCRARAELLAPFGLAPNEVRLDGYLLGTQVESDPTGSTAVPGVWVAGNMTSIQAQVISSAAGGLAAAAAMNNDLITDDTEQAVQTHRARRAIQDP